jgi:pyruvate dehydrogenase E2 component (dihydrolipoamide acetyltransferase)
MPIKILMPALSPTMTEGNLATWLKKEGDTIAPGDVIAEIETDKATMEVEAVDEGKLGADRRAGGNEGVAVNQVIGLPPRGGRGRERPRALPMPAGNGSDAPKPGEGGRLPRPRQRKSPKPGPPPAMARMGGRSSRIFASPLARRMARKAARPRRPLRQRRAGGSVKADIETALERAWARPRPPTADKPAPKPAEKPHRQPARPRRQVPPTPRTRRSRFPPCAR